MHVTQAAILLREKHPTCDKHIHEDCHKSHIRALSSCFLSRIYIKRLYLSARSCSDLCSHIHTVWLLKKTSITKNTTKTNPVFTNVLTPASSFLTEKPTHSVWQIGSQPEPPTRRMLRNYCLMEQKLTDVALYHLQYFHPNRRVCISTNVSIMAP